MEQGCSLPCHSYLYDLLVYSTEIVWVSEISRFKNQPCNRLYPKKPAGMYWLGYNDAVSWLNEAKTRIFSPQPILKFSKFTYISFASQPAIRPGCARCRAPEISHDKGGFTKMLFRSSLAWPDRFFRFSLWRRNKGSGSQTQLVLAPSTVVGGDNNKNVINALTQSRTRLVQTCAFG